MAYYQGTSTTFSGNRLENMPQLLGYDNAGTPIYASYWSPIPPSVMPSPAMPQRHATRSSQEYSVASPSEYETAADMASVERDLEPTLIVDVEIDGQSVRVLNDTFSALALSKGPELWDSVKLGSNWPYTNSFLDPVQDADFNVNSATL